MKRFIHFILAGVLLSFYSTNLISQHIISTAPVNEVYTNYKQNKSISKFGYKPSPMVWHYSKNQSKESMDLPATYDLRSLGYVSPVKNQGSFGPCWSFGAMANLESNWLMNSFGSFDLSEENMATCHDFEWAKDDGGNKEIAAAYLTRLSGPVSETDDPYSLSSTTCKGREFNRIAYVTEVRFPAKSITNLKNAVKNYGATPISIYWDDVFYNASENTYHYSGNDDSNHAVTVVGWDDNQTTDGGTGAWIVKNSWGTSWGDGGFFYLSYQDTYSAAEINYYPERKDASAYDELFMYDKFGAISSIGFGNDEIVGLVKYTADKRYRIPTIGLFVSSDQTTLTIGVYEKFISNVLSERLCEISETVSMPGYYSFDLPEIYVEGDFYVRVKYKAPGSEFPIPVESLGSPDYCVPTIESNKCWISPLGSTWYQLGVGGVENGEVDLCIRAYAKSATGTGIKTLSDGGFSVYPNPSNGDIEISMKQSSGILSENVSIAIYSISGQEVYNDVLRNDNLTFKLNLQDKISAGTYILKLQSKEKVYTEKLIIQ